MHLVFCEEVVGKLNYRACIILNTAKNIFILIIGKFMFSYPIYTSYSLKQMSSNFVE